MTVKDLIVVPKYNADNGDSTILKIMSGNASVSSLNSMFGTNLEQLVERKNV